LPSAQRGASALVALVFLVVIAFVVLTAYRLSGQQLALAGNAQSRAQMLAASSSCAIRPQSRRRRLVSTSTATAATT
jgi:Tfp pilus assembly protein PilX